MPDNEDNEVLNDMTREYIEDDKQLWNRRKNGDPEARSVEEASMAMTRDRNSEEEYYAFVDDAVSILRRLHIPKRSIKKKNRTIIHIPKTIYFRGGTKRKKRSKKRKSCKKIKSHKKKKITG